MKKILKYILKAFLTITLLIVVDIVYLWNWGVEKNSNKIIYLPEPKGGYVIGRTLFDWTDSTRHDPFDTLKKRELMVWVWYPVTKVKGYKQSEYIPGKWGQSSSKWHALDIHMHVHKGLTVLIPNSPISAKTIQNIQTHSFDNALMDSSAYFPVLFFSPGLGMMPTDYTSLIEEIVSHGYIVVGVNPTHFVSSTYFSNGESVGGIPLSKLNEDLEDFFHVWVNDLLFSLQKIKEQNSLNTSILSHHINLNQIGIFGHSYGGAVAGAACFKDSIFKAGINMDGSPRGDTTQWKLKQPFLIIQSDQGIHRDRNALQFYHDLKNGRLIIIKNAYHRAFTDESFYPLSNDDKNELLGKLNGTKMISLTSQCIITFFDVYLKQQPENSIDTLKSIDTAIRFE